MVKYLWIILEDGKGFVGFMYGVNMKIKDFCCRVRSSGSVNSSENSFPIFLY